MRTEFNENRYSPPSSSNDVLRRTNAHVVFRRLSRARERRRASRARARHRMTHATPCDSCKRAVARVHCDADGARLCLRCDRTVRLSRRAMRRVVVVVHGVVVRWDARRVHARQRLTSFTRRTHRSIRSRGDLGRAFDVARMMRDIFMHENIPRRLFRDDRRARANDGTRARERRDSRVGEESRRGEGLTVTRARPRARACVERRYTARINLR